MTRNHSFRTLLSFVFVAAFTACGGIQSPGPSSGLPISGEQRHPAGSWMAAGASDENLLYISDPVNAGIFVYTYFPDGLKFAGFLVTGAEPGGLCVDKAQDVWATTSSSEVFEYAHGGTSPIAALADPVGITMSCAIDPTTGNLAVVSFNVGGHIAIYKHAAGKPKMYALGGFGTMRYCAYDNRGNLFVDGNVYGGVLHFAELPKGKSSLVNVSLNQTFVDASGVQRIGKQIAIADAIGEIYRFTISGNNGTLVGSTILDDSTDVNQFYVDGNRVISPNLNGDEEDAGVVNIYGYPKGGTPLRRLRFSYPIATVVSRATGS